MSAGTVRHVAAYRALCASVKSGRLGPAQVNALRSILRSVEASSKVLDQVDNPDRSSTIPTGDLAARCGVAEFAIDAYRDAIKTLGGAGGGLGRRVPSADAARDDADLITRAQVIDLMRAMGRPIGVASLYNYGRTPPAGWPGIVKYVGRTPQWSRQAIEVYASAPARRA